MGCLLSVDRVAFAYGNVPILEDVSLELHRGSFLGLVGPNGSGKSTLLRVAAGLARPSTGTVSLEGRAVARISRGELARTLALLPQDASLPRAFTVDECVLMGRTPFLGWFGRESESDFRAAERAMEMANCRHLAGRLVGELSGGERRRVMLAQALAQEPRVLLLDEPTAHLDVRYQVGIAELVAGLVEDGLAALAVFHDLNLAACYCHRLALLSEGRIVAEGAPSDVLRLATLQEVYESPLCLTSHPYVGVPAVLPPGLRHQGAVGGNGREREDTAGGSADR